MYSSRGRGCNIVIDVLIIKNRFRSGGEENKKRMANNVMQEMRVYDGYLVCLDLA